MPKRERTEQCGCRTAKRPALEGKQHLYVLLDDWERGYSVRRLDVDDFDADDTDLPPASFTEPPPPVARIEAADAHDYNFVSHDTKIFSMQPGEASPGIPVFDTRTLGMSVCPWPDSGCRDFGFPLFVSAAGKLFVFMNTRAVYLGDQPPPGSKTPWSWTAMNPRPPFYSMDVKCYALHPDGRTLFVSAASRRRHRSGTFSLDAERLEWTRRGDWLLPFAGQAYYDAELEAWAGLCRERDNAGRLCSCDVVAPVAVVGEPTSSPPSWKIGEDRLFREDYSERLRLGSKLVYMGNSKFCFVERLFHKDDDDILIREKNELHVDRHYYWPRRRRRRVVHLTTFGLKYNKQGQLRTSKLQRAHACMMFERPCYLGGSSDPLAFWL